MDRTKHKYLQNVIEFRDKVFKQIEKNSDEPPVWVSNSLKDVKKIIIVLSAPRSGSSLLFYLLRQLKDIYSLRGEEVPFYKLNQINYNNSKSDFISPEIIDLIHKNNLLNNLSRDLLSEFSTEDESNEIMNNKKVFDEYVNSLALRFAIEWPQISFSYESFKNITSATFNNYKEKHTTFHKELFYLELIYELRKKHSCINPYYYDIDKKIIKAKFPKLKISEGPPNNTIMIEEPPFILISPEKKITKNNLNDNILLLKSSVNTYRMDFIKEIFPSAKIKIIYLMRNPAASINGLYDGWNYRGFFSHNIKEMFKSKYGDIKIKELNIKGYSDVKPWGKWWWNYDLAENWEEYTNKNIYEVCAFQWATANKIISKYLDDNLIEVIRTKYENLVHSLDSRKNEISKIIKFIGTHKNALEEINISHMPFIQTTTKPKQFRWIKRKKNILPIIKSPEISEVSQHIGYDTSEINEWV